MDVYKEVAKKVRKVTSIPQGYCGSLETGEDILFVPNSLLGQACKKGGCDGCLHFIKGSCKRPSTGAYFKAEDVSEIIANSLLREEFESQKSASSDIICPECKSSNIEIKSCEDVNISNYLCRDCGNSGSSEEDGADPTYEEALAHSHEMGR